MSNYIKPREALNDLLEMAKRGIGENPSLMDTSAYGYARQEIGKLVSRDEKTIVTTEKGFYGMRFPVCPNCKEAVPPLSVFCPECGQRLDWDDYMEKHEKGELR